MVDMSEEEIVDRSIPVSSELVPGYTIPPVALYSGQGLYRGDREQEGE